MTRTRGQELVTAGWASPAIVAAVAAAHAENRGQDPVIACIIAQAAGEITELRAALDTARADALAPIIALCGDRSRHLEPWRTAATPHIPVSAALAAARADGDDPRAPRD